MTRLGRKESCVVTCSVAVNCRNSCPLILRDCLIIHYEFIKKRPHVAIALEANYQRKIEACSILLKKPLPLLRCVRGSARNSSHSSFKRPPSQMSEGGEADAVCELTKCAACESIRYCSDECERDHRQQHEGACEKRAAELRDEILFKQPESSYLGDCPICFVPLPLDPLKTTLMTCCSKIICDSCFYAHALRNLMKQTCAFCRHPPSKSEAEEVLNLMKRVEKNDPVAMRQMGGMRYCEGDYSSAFEYWTKAAELGDAMAHHHLAGVYYEGESVEKDERKALYHWEESAIGGHPGARFMVAAFEMENGRPKRAVKHYIIAAILGCELSMKALWECFSMGHVSKDDLTVTLRTHQAAVDATKSPQRKAAEEAMRRA